MSDLLNTLKEYVTPAMIASSARMLGENEIGVSKAVGGIPPTILARLLEKTENQESLDSLFARIKQFDPAVLDHLDKLLASGNLAYGDPRDQSGELMGLLFEHKVAPVINAIAAFSGLKQSSVSSLLGMAGPLTFGYLSRIIRDGDMNRNTFLRVLMDEKEHINLLLPVRVRNLWSDKHRHESLKAKLQDDEEMAATGLVWWKTLAMLLAAGVMLAVLLKHV